MDDNPNTEPIVSPPTSAFGVEILRTPWAVWYWDESDHYLRRMPNHMRRPNSRVKLEAQFRRSPDRMVRLAHAMRVAAQYEATRISVRYPYRTVQPLRQAVHAAREKAIAAGDPDPKRRYGLRGPNPDDPVTPIRGRRKDAWMARLGNEVVVLSFDGELWIEDQPGGGMKR